VNLTNASSDLTRRLEQLLGQRQQLAEAMARIDETLTQIGSALGTRGRRPGRPPGRPPADASFAPVAGGKRRKRRRRSFDLKAEDFVLNLVKAHRSPTTQEINAEWKREGRGATADNTLTKLVKERRLKRVPLGEGIRGSRYTAG